MDELISQAQAVKRAGMKLAIAGTAEKNNGLLRISEAIKKHSETILRANELDIRVAREKGIRQSMIDRLALNEKRISEMIESCLKVADLEDQVGKYVSSWIQKDGLRISKVRVPLGPIGIIYESRPNVTLEASILAIKAGNPVLLRGGSDAFNSNLAIVKAMKEGLKNSGLPEETVEYLSSPDRTLVDQMLKLRDYLSLIVPRGSGQLIDYVVNNSIIPVLETGTGNCHIYVDDSAVVGKSLEIIDNAKTQRPGTCNAVETVLINARIASEFLPKLVERLQEKGVEIRGCERTTAIVDVKNATEADWETEYLDLILAVKVVDTVEDAIAHIQRYSSGHSEAILTENYSNAQLFTNSIDSAAVYVNASTRFTDGSQFGFGGEIGISTQRLHARGPVGIEELTTYKYVILGDYQARK